MGGALVRTTTPQGILVVGIDQTHSLSVFGQVLHKARIVGRRDVAGQGQHAQELLADMEVDVKFLVCRPECNPISLLPP